MMKITKRIENSFNKACVKVHGRLELFRKDERGLGAFEIVVGCLVIVLLMFGLYKVFKEELDSFVKDVIMSKLKNLT